MEARKQLLPPSAQRRRRGGDGETTCSCLLCHVKRHPSKRRDGAADRRSCVPTLQAKIHPAAHPGSQSNLKTAIRTTFLDSCTSVHTTQTSHLTLYSLEGNFWTFESRGDKEKDLLPPTSPSDLKSSLIGTSKVFRAATKSRRPS